MTLLRSNRSASGVIRSVTVCGAGTMGTWIAGEIAAAGIDVAMVDTSAEATARARAALASAGREGEAAPVRFTAHLSEAVDGTDLVIETIVESPSAKAALFRDLERVCAPSTLVTTNTSALLASEFAGDLACTERFAYLHFLRPRSAVEIMPGPATSYGTLERLASFARRIGEYPIVLRQESRAYLLGAVLGPALDAALDLVARGVAAAEDIDRAFMAVLGAEGGPFGTMDAIGLDTSLSVRRQRASREPANERLANGIRLLEDFVARGRLGVKSGSGFYDHPGPAYTAPGFLDPASADSPRPDRETAASPAADRARGNRRRRPAGDSGRLDGTHGESAEPPGPPRPSGRPESSEASDPADSDR